MKIDLCTINWVAISALVSFLMVFFTWRSLRQMKRQRNEERQPRLNFSIAISQQTWCVLKISNIGQLNAYNINVEFNESFIDILSEKYKGYFERLQAKPFAIEAGRSLYFIICIYEEWKNDCNEIQITGKYCDRYRIKENMELVIKYR